jgi:hypothetical protein
MATGLALLNNESRVRQQQHAIGMALQFVPAFPFEQLAT